MRAQFEKDHLQTLTDALEWYEVQLALLNDEDRRLPWLFETGTAPERYAGSTLLETRQRLAEARRQLELVGMLHLLTTTEALLRIDFDIKTTTGPRTKAARQFRRVKRERGKQIRLKDDVLDTWIAVHPETAKAVRDFKSLVPLRDWLAHGRHWTPKLNRTRYYVRDVFEISAELLRTLDEVDG